MTFFKNKLMSDFIMDESAKFFKNIKFILFPVEQINRDKIINLHNQPQFPHSILSQNFTQKTTRD